MKTYRLDLAYDGTRYKGWQRLGDDENTIQNKLEATLSRLLDEAIEVVGSGRTDAGVHALQQVASFQTKADVQPAKLMNQLNHYLPGEITVLALTEEKAGFNARHDVKGKTYRYQIWNAPLSHPMERRFRVHVPERLSEKAMKKAAGFMIGTHDFSAFTTAKSKKKSMEREVKSIDFVVEGPKMDIVVTGEGFLYNMVRIIAGTILEVGAGRMKAEDIPAILESKTRSQAGPLAPANGLVLCKVEYEINLDGVWKGWEKTH